jgi:membrane-associated phospholipid phosphatase
MGGKQCLLAAACVLLCSRAAAAQPPPPEGKSKLSYLIDGGAIPFLWLPLAGRIVMDTWTTPRETPLGFSRTEGGAPKASWEIPGWGISALGGVLAAGMLGSGDSARAYHIKGLAESLATGVLVTAVIKVAVGRHRPDWNSEVDTPGSRRSFPSGHATQAFAIATYAALFLRGHVFDRARGDRTLPWWEAATYGGLLLAAGGLAGERVLHDRHHLTDVAVGAVLGTASSSLFYWYQEGRHDDHQREVSLTPQLSGGAPGMALSFTW